ncbi:MAG: chromatin modification- protein VID21 [Trizodia sp. TS-e1964]|nr:MAG: chromatin modification- protein VID21 [Trizodia sp. TS-e1964]
MTLVVDREAVLRCKRLESEKIVLSRKRKLRELYAVAQCTDRRPQQHLDLAAASTPHATTSSSVHANAETGFLEANNIEKGRFFNPTTLPSLFLHTPSHQEPPHPSPSPSPSPLLATKPAPLILNHAIPQTAQQNGGQPNQLPFALGHKALRPNQDVPQKVEGAVAVSATAHASGIEGRIGQNQASKAAQTDPITASASSHINTAELHPLVNLSPSITEQLSSPASTSDPFSVHTPLANTESMDTSPDNDSSSVDARKTSSNVMRLAHQGKYPPDIQDVVDADVIKRILAQPRGTVDVSEPKLKSPLRVTTPDDQLRLEEAQAAASSLKNGRDFFQDQLPQSSPAPVLDRDISVLGKRHSIVLPPEETNIEDIVSPDQPTNPLTLHPQITEDSLVAEPEIFASQTGILNIGPPDYRPSQTPSDITASKVISDVTGDSQDPTSKESSPARPDSDSTVKKEKAPDRSSITSPSISSSPRPIKPRISKQKERRLSSIVFAKQRRILKPDPLNLVTTGPYSASPKPPQDTQDYLLPLFIAQTAQPLSTLLSSAHKTVTTSNQYVDFHEKQDCRILKRISHLQYSNRWSFRQMKRSTEPIRPRSHWDYFLQEMKWMQTDFREERKWKTAAARNMAVCCAEWINSNPEDRKSLQVKIKQSVGISVTQQQDEGISMSDPPPKTLLSPLPAASDQTKALSLISKDEGEDTIQPPAAIFVLPVNDIVFGIPKTPSSDKLLSELPLYEPPRDLPSHEHPSSKICPDSSWKTPAVPVSKYMLGKMVADDSGPPRKKSRYDYWSDDDEATDAAPEIINSAFSFYGARKSRFELTPEQTDVALFNPDNKHIRDRIHAGHQFRPPSEHAMPSQSFFESRLSSQWTWTEDDELRALVREYSYNWSLISSMLSPKSLFSSGAERRTPWECFERWISLEGLPADMQKTQYFRAYNARLEAAQRNILSQPAPGQQQQQQQPQQGQGQPNSTPTTAIPQQRRRATTSIRVDRRKATKHLALIDAMRKLAKKRESTVQKQQHAAGLAAQRKANEGIQPRQPVHSPATFSKMKYERELKYQEKAEEYRQRMIATQRAAIQQRAAQVGQQQSAMNGTVHPQRANMPATANSIGSMGTNLQNGPNQLSAPNQTRPPSTIQSIPNVMSGQSSVGMPVSMSPGMNLGQPMAMKGIPTGPTAQRIPDVRIQEETSRLSAEQKARAAHQMQQFHLQQQHMQQRQQLQQQQQRQFQGQQARLGQLGPSSSPNSSTLSIASVQQSMRDNSAMMAALQAVNPNTNMMSTSPANPYSIPGNAMGSPRLSHTYPSQTNQQQLLGGLSPAMNPINPQYKPKYPNMSPEQQYQRKFLQQQQRMTQEALTAAAGGVAHVGSGLIQQPAMPITNDIYAQYIRTQQANQSRTLTNQALGPVGLMNGMPGSAQRPPSRSATPQMQRTSSVQGPAQQGQSPSLSQAQMALGQ